MGSSSEALVMEPLHPFPWVVCLRESRWSGTAAVGPPPNSCDEMHERIKSAGLRWGLLRRLK